MTASHELQTPCFPHLCEEVRAMNVQFTELNPFPLVRFVCIADRQLERRGVTNGQLCAADTVELLQALENLRVPSSVVRASADVRWRGVEVDVVVSVLGPAVTPHRVPTPLGVIRLEHR